MRNLAWNAVNYSMDSHWINVRTVRPTDRQADGRYKSPLNTFQIEKSCFRVLFPRYLYLFAHTVYIMFYINSTLNTSSLANQSSLLLARPVCPSIGLSVSVSAAISQRLLSEATLSGKVAQMKKFLLRLLENQAKDLIHTLTVK